MTDRLFDEHRVTAYVAWSCRRRSWVLGSALVLTVGGAAVGSRIQLDTDIVDLLPASTPSVQRLDQVLEKTGGFGDLMVMIESPSSDRSVALAAKLLPEVRALPWVDLAHYEIDTTVFERHQLLYMKLEDLETIRGRVDNYIREQKIRHSPFFVDVGDDPPPRLDFSDIETRYESLRENRNLHASPDGRILILVVEPTGLTSDVGAARRMFDDLQQVVYRHWVAARDRPLRVSIGGTYRNRLDEYDTVVHDVKSTAVWAGLGILLLLVVYFRGLRLALFSVVPLLMSLSWTLAVTELAIGRLNLITVFLAIVLLGLGIDFGIHLLSRYANERGAGAGLRPALVAMIHRTGRAAVTAALTTSAAFFALTFSDFLGFSQFGFIAGIGVLLALLAYLVVLPSLIVAADARGWLPRPVPTLAGDSGPDGPRAHSPERKRRVLLAMLLAAGAVTIAAVAVAPGVGFEQNLANLRSRAPATREFNRKMREVFHRARDPAVVLVGDSDEARRLEKYIRRDLVERSEALVEEVRSLASLLPAQQPRKLEILAHIKNAIDREREVIPEAKREQIAELERHLDVGPVRVADLPRALTRQFLGLPGTSGELVYLFQSRSLLDLRNAIPFYRAVREIRTPFGTYYPVSEPLLYVQLILLLARDAVIAVFAAAAAIALMVLLDMRSVRGTVLVLAALTVGVLWMLGIMSATGIKLNVFNLVVLPSIMGIGVDTAVHLAHRIREDGGRVHVRTLRQAGGAAAVSSITTMIGFGGLIAAEHPGLRSIGLLAVAGVGACFAAAAAVVPALSFVLRARELGRAGDEVN